MPWRSLQTILDISMLALIAMGSYALLFDHVTQYKWLIIFIMLGYLYYFIQYRVSLYRPDSRQYKVHDMPRYVGRKKEEREDVINNSIFLQEFDKRSHERSQREAAKDDLDKSYRSYMNRSLRVNESVIKSSKSVNSSDNGFDFLNSSMSKSMRESSAGRSRGLNDSYVKNIEVNKTREEAVAAESQKTMRQCMSRYNQTLDKLKIKDRSKVTLAHQKIKQLCLKFVDEALKENIQNLQTIVLGLQQIYDIKVRVKDYPELDKILTSNNIKRESTLEVSLIEVIDKLLKKAPLNYQEKKLKAADPSSTHPLYNTTFTSQLTSPPEKILRLVEDRLRLNSYFYDNETLKLSGEQLMRSLASLKQYRQQEINSSARYELSFSQRVPQQLSQKLVLTLAVARNKLNDMVFPAQHRLFHKTTTFFGWIRSETHDFELRQTVNSDLGHPHFDVRANIGTTEDYSCKYGPENGFSCLYMYMWALVHRQPQTLKGNLSLLRVVSECLDTMIL